MTTATAQAHPNIALIKYWGKKDTVGSPGGGGGELSIDGRAPGGTVFLYGSVIGGLR